MARSGIRGQVHINGLENVDFGEVEADASPLSKCKHISLKESLVVPIGKVVPLLLR
jgi:hypothetical protein